MPIQLGHIPVLVWMVMKRMKWVKVVEVCMAIIIVIDIIYLYHNTIGKMMIIIMRGKCLLVASGVLRSSFSFTVILFWLSLYCHTVWLSHAGQCQEPKLW